MVTEYQITFGGLFKFDSASVKAVAGKLARILGLTEESAVFGAPYPKVAEPCGIMLAVVFGCWGRSIEEESIFYALTYP